MILIFIWCLLVAGHYPQACGEAAGAKGGRGKGLKRGLVMHHGGVSI